MCNTWKSINHSRSTAVLLFQGNSDNPTVLSLWIHEVHQFWLKSSETPLDGPIHLLYGPYEPYSEAQFENALTARDYFNI